MVGLFKKLSEKLTNRMMAPGAEEADYYYDDGYDYYEDDGYYDEAPEPVQVRSTRQENSSRKSNTKSSSSRSSSRTSSRDNVLFTPSSTTAANKQLRAESIIKYPKNMEDAVEIGQHVRSGRMCIVDLTGVPNDEAQRIADYLCGNSDALDGAITRVNQTIITVSPTNHHVRTDYREDSHFEAGYLRSAANDR